MKSFICFMAVIVAAGPVLAWEGAPSGGHSLSKDCYESLQRLTAERSVIQDVEESDLGMADDRSDVPEAQGVAGDQAFMDKPSSKTMRNYLFKTFDMMDCFTLDSRGRIVASLHKTNTFVHSKEPYFIHCYNHGQGALFLDKPEKVAETTGEVVKIALPVRDGERTVGVLVATVLLN